MIGKIIRLLYRIFMFISASSYFYMYKKGAIPMKELVLSLVALFFIGLIVTLVSDSQNDL
jgi:hypothetical protein